MKLLTWPHRGSAELGMVRAPRVSLIWVLLLASHGSWALKMSSGTSQEEAAFMRSLSRAFATVETEAEGGSDTAQAFAEPLFQVSPVGPLDVEEGATVVVDPLTDGLLVKAGVQPTAGVAWGFLRDRLSSTGWIELTMHTSQSDRVPNGMRMYGAGLLEGLLTAPRISQFYANSWQLLQRDDASARALKTIMRVFQMQLNYLKNHTNMASGNIAMEPPDDYWKHARYVLLQLWGMRDGYNIIAKKRGVNTITFLDLFAINAHAEIPELIQAYVPEAVKARQEHHGRTQVVLAQEDNFLQRKPADSLASEPLSKEVQDSVDRDWEDRLMKRGHCSAFVRVSPSSSDLMVGHTTWSDYSKMTRIFKYYHFRLPGADTHASVIGFSSYPGCVSSTDNFYMLSSGLVTMDTSLEVLDPDEYLRVPEFPANPTVPTFIHVMVANRLAMTGAQWASIMGAGGGGAASAQWMVVDYNQFKVGAAVPDRMVWIVEKIPGVVQKGDVSHWVREHGYWASYNRPFFSEVRRLSGHKAAEAKYGSLYSYEQSPRGVIFSRMGPASENLFDMRHMMNRNGYPNEGVTPSRPGHAVSARMDLESPTPVPNGGIDAKVTNRCLLRLMQCQAISGPTHEEQPVFKWVADGTEIFKGWPHYGLPDVWNFDWVQMAPSEGFMRIVDKIEC